MEASLYMHIDKYFQLAALVANSRSAASPEERQLLCMHRLFKLRCLRRTLVAALRNFFNFTETDGHFSNRRHLERGPAASGSPLAASRWTERR